MQSGSGAGRPTEGVGGQVGRGIVRRVGMSRLLEDGKGRPGERITSKDRLDGIQGRKAFVDAQVGRPACIVTISGVVFCRVWGCFGPGIGGDHRTVVRDAARANIRAIVIDKEVGRGIIPGIKLGGKKDQAAGEQQEP